MRVVQQILQGKQMRDLRDFEQLIRVLDKGDFMTREEMGQVADIIRALKDDADRYRWLNQATHQLFMVSERDLNEQVDRAMNGGRE
tara:strand:+ start:404 stop:661 length:258 start_codon:yes stop_codon:yes gene_type:complete